MSRHSYCFRDLESVGEEKRKSAILLALVASLDDLRDPNPAESKKISELFIPLFKAVPKETQRKAASALSRCPFVPANVAEFICLQPLDIAAPFLSHSPSLTNPILCYVIASMDVSYAKLIAKRDDLNKRVIQSLLALGDKGVHRALQLRGYIADTAVLVEKSETRIDLSLEEEAQNIRAGEVEFFDMAETSIHPMAGEVELFDQLEALMETNQPALDPVETIEIPEKRKPRIQVNYVKRDRAELKKAQLEKAKALELEEKVSKMDLEADKLGVEHSKLDSSIGEHSPSENMVEENLRNALRALASDTSAPVEPEALVAANEELNADEDILPLVLPMLKNELRHRKFVKILSKHVANNHLEYFTTSLADALGSSYELAERIMGDMSGRQLALTFNAILLPEAVCLDALNKFFPHVSMMAGTQEGAESLLAELQHGESMNRLMLWVRADHLTTANSPSTLAMSEADIDYEAIDINNLPYVKPVADNVDRAPVWPEEKTLEDGDDWLSAIAK